MCWGHIATVKALSGIGCPKFAMDMTPKTQKRPRKGSSKKKKKLLLHEDTAGPSGKAHVPTEVVVSVENTPPRENKQNSPQLSDDFKGAEWQYHGRFTDSDVHVVWGSPQASPVLKSVKKGNESPLPPTLKSRVISEEPCELQFIAEILELPEKIKAQKDVAKRIETNVETKNDTSSNRANESYSELFDEDMNDIIMKCSQEFEENIGVSHPPASGNKLVHQQAKYRSKIGGSSNFVDVHPSESSAGSSNGPSSSKLCTSSDKATRRSPRVGNKNYVYSTSSVNKFYYRGRALGTPTNVRPSENVPQSRVSPRRTKRCLLDSETSVVEHVPVEHTQKNVASNVNSAADLGKGTFALDTSFTRVKEAFLEDDLDLMSTIPVGDDLELAITAPVEALRGVGGTGEKQVAAVVAPPPASGDRGAIQAKQQGLGSGLDDSTFFEEDVLQFLDSVETSVAPTQPFRCTPEEIEKKRQRAKLKLSKKKEEEEELEKRRLEAKLKLQRRKAVPCGKKQLCS